MRAIRRAVLAAVLGAAAYAAGAEGDHTLWYAQPASEWNQALPLGNGRLGAMVFGTVGKERLALNEESLWAGAPLDVYPDDFRQHLDKVQQLILDGQIDEAHKYGRANMTQQPTSFRSYEPLGDLWMEFPNIGTVSDYWRDLDIQSGVATVSYVQDGVCFTREVFISAVDDLMAIKLSADKPGKISAKIGMSRPKDMTVTVQGDRLMMDGQVVDVEPPEGYDDNPGGSGPGGEHMKFAGRLLARTSGGTVSADGDALVIADADEVVLLFTAKTDYNVEKLNFDRSIDPGAASDAILAKVVSKPWKTLLADHIADHRALFDRVSLDLGGHDASALPTDRRLQALKKGGDDPALLALYFQYGRYLLMASSRPTSQLPANLQGIWSRKMWAAWEADFHLNINLQMNYWPADLCNLSETVDPLIKWFVPTTEKGRVAAQKLYGADGWLIFLSTNPFGRTTPSGSTLDSQFDNGVLDPLCGAWMAMTLWRHYEFNPDRTFLAETAYPVLKGAAEFLLDYLVEDADGRLVVVPSTSPENSYLHPGTGKAVRITKGSTYSTAIVSAVFDAVIRGGETLGIDAGFRRELQQAMTRFPPVKIGADGTIQEWVEDYREAQPGHRHISHLIGLHPFALITQEDKALFEAAVKTVERRLGSGGGHTGWSRAWVINFYARLLDGDAAHEHAVKLLQKSTLPNLFDNHPPFQIDGNFGGTAGMAEMLLQSHAGTVHLLPALPEAWPNGAVRGLRARGGLEVDLTWSDGKVTAGLTADHAGTYRVRFRDRILPVELKAGERRVLAFGE